MPSENALPGRPTSFSIQSSKPQPRIQKRFSCRPDAFKPKGNSGTTKPNQPTASGQNHEKTHPHPLPNRRYRHIRGRIRSHIRRKAHRRIGSPNRRFGTPHRRIGAQLQHSIPPEPFGLRMQRDPLPKNLRSSRPQRRPGTRQSPPRLQRRNLGHVLRRPRHPLQTLRLNGSALAAADCARLRFRPSEKHARRIFRRPPSTLLHQPL